MPFSYNSLQRYKTTGTHSMELVYLWVEDYKNIKKEGFNFSPRFECIYDEVKNELTIDENKEYANIFPENINVTAIVGENGSGKSSLLKLLENSSEFDKLNTFLVYIKEKKYYYVYNNIQPKIIFHKNVTKINISDFTNINFYSPKIAKITNDKKIGKDGLSMYYFGDYPSSCSEDFIDVDRKNSYNILEARFFVPRYINIIIDFPDFLNKSKYLYIFDTLRLVLRNNSTSYLKKWLDNEKNQFKLHRTIINSSDYSKVCIYEKNQEMMNLIRKLRVPKTLIDSIEINLYNRDREVVVSLVQEIENIHRAQTSNEHIREFNKYQELDLGILIGFIEYYLKHTCPCESIETIKEELLSIKESILTKHIQISRDFMRITDGYILNFFKNLKIKNFKFKETNLLNIDELINAVDYLQTLKINYFDFDGNPYIDIPINSSLKENLHHIKILQKIFLDHESDIDNEKFLRVFEYNLINSDNNSSYNSISDGEKQFIRFSIDIIYCLQSSKKEKLLLFLADEPDNAMHPMWKKKLIENAIETLQFFKVSHIKTHFIYSTHSPFLLSDIPKENIIFLRKDDIGNCKNVTKETEIETFGANIHTLLSHGFFMESGLMGEFAKTKINEVIKFLNQDSSEITTKEEAKKVINIIGEPFLKKRLLELYNKQYPPSKKEEEIQTLEKRLKELKNADS